MLYTQTLERGNPLFSSAVGNWGTILNEFFLNTLQHLLSTAILKTSLRNI
jgi:hypothetical protein